MSERRDSYAALRDQIRWRFALLLCVTGLTTMVLLGVMNALAGRRDSVWLSVVVFVVLAVCLVMLLKLPRSLGGQIYFWLSVGILAFLPWFGYVENRTFHYWAYVLPPVLFFLMRPRPALIGMLVFGIYVCVMLTPFTAPVDIARIALSYLLLVGFLYTYAKLEEGAGAMLRYHSDHDALTNCWNRRIFNERLQQLEADPGDGHIFLLMDIDRFKAINDQHGHLVGDRVITQAAAVIGRQLPNDVALFRYGGEEFAAIVPGTDMADAAALSERVRQAVEGADFGPMRVTLSVGLAAWRPKGSSLAAALDAADRALYAAKRGGRNRVIVSEATA